MNGPPEITDDDTLALARQLIARPSVTPRDEGCQVLVAGRLSAAGFDTEFMPHGEVSNLWLRRNSEPPLVTFLGHTDVVPTGPLEQWRFDPFSSTLADGRLWGRGAADMKSSIAAFTTAAARFVEDHPDHRGSISVLLTSDEEGPAVDGTVKVIDTLTARGEHIDYCIVGEPTSVVELGDTIKIGRRGSLSGRLVLHGVAGHVAYPQLAANPVHLVAPALADFTSREWDQGDDHFPHTTFQVTRVSTGDNAGNVIPGRLEVDFNFRHSTVSPAHNLIPAVETTLEQHELTFDLEWTVSAKPFVTRSSELIDVVQRAIRQELGVEAEASTTGGTSDGRFVAPTGAQVVELGPINASIHKIDENVTAGTPQKLSKVYYQILVSLLT